MGAPRVLVLYNHPVLPEDHPAADSEHTIVEIAEKMNQVLQSAGYTTQLFGLKHDPTTLWRELQRRKPNVVFNLYEGLVDDTETESYVAGLLQWSGIPYTGSPMPTLALARNKAMTKLVLRGAKLPTADFFTVDMPPAPPNPFDWPVIVKPAKQDASVGLDQQSVCTNQAQLKRRVEYIYETFGPPVLVEEYVRGREFNVALLELPTLEFLPPAEILFPEEKDGYWPILTYAGKWTPGTPDYETTPPRYPADIPAAMARKLGRIAMATFRAMGCQDYARVDFRLRPDGRPFILEVNPNPEISSHAGFSGCLGSASLEYSDFIVRLITQAIARGARASSRGLKRLSLPG